MVGNLIYFIILFVLFFYTPRLAKLSLIFLDFKNLELLKSEFFCLTS